VIDQSRLALGIWGCCCAIALFGQTSASVGVVGRSILIFTDAIAAAVVVAWLMPEFRHLRMRSAASWWIDTILLCGSVSLVTIRTVQAFGKIYASPGASSGNAVIDLALIFLPVAIIMLFALGWPAVLLIDDLDLQASQSASNGPLAAVYAVAPNPPQSTCAAGLKASPDRSESGGVRKAAVPRSPRPTQHAEPEALLAARDDRPPQCTAAKIAVGVLVVVAVVACGAALFISQGAQETALPAAAMATNAIPSQTSPTASQATEEVASDLPSGAATSSKTTGKPRPDVARARKGSSRAPP
jgi:hypothetical protein